MMWLVANIIRPVIAPVPVAHIAQECNNHAKYYVGEEPAIHFEVVPGGPDIVYRARLVVLCE